MSASSETEKLLGFTPAWRVLGIVDDARLRALRARWDRGEDDNTEHYRWQAFSEFLHARRPLSPGLAGDLFALGAADPDAGAGDAMMAAVVWLVECPEDVLARAAASGRRYVVRAVEQRSAAGGVPIPHAPGP